MKTVYVNRAEVFATPMTRAKYNFHRGWQVPDDEDPNDAGFLIENPNGTSNHPDHKGYINWLPEEQFNTSYSAEPKTVPERMAVEIAELEAKLTKLSQFIQNKQPLSIGDYEWGLLLSQKDIMTEYLSILKLRLKLM